MAASQNSILENYFESTVYESAFKNKKIQHEYSYISYNNIKRKKEPDKYIIRPSIWPNETATATSTTSSYLTWNATSSSDTTVTSYDLNDLYVSGFYNWNKGKPTWVGQSADPMQRIRMIIRNRQAPLVLQRTTTNHAVDDREFRARQTLRRMIGEEAYLRFLKRGFISVKAKSGRIYQIFTGHRTTVCWENGKPIKSLCVTLRGGFAPTDELIMRYILITTDEENFWKRANVWAAYPREYNQQRQVDFRPLPDILAELRRVA